ncbi:HlyD family type I secretion periplasmic adaptor subunit [Rhizobium sp. PAMB 3182]
MFKALTLLPDDADASQNAASEFISDSAEILNAAIPKAARMTVTVVAAFVGVAILLSILIPIERVVSSTGRIISEAPHVVIQPIETSIVREIHVREGQRVNKGEILATLDPTFSEADATSWRRQVGALKAEIERLYDEVDGRPYRPLGNDLFTELQQRYYSARKSQYDSAITNLNGKVAAIEALRRQLSSELHLFGQRLDILKQTEAMKASLVERQAISKMELLQVSDNRLELERQIAGIQGQLSTSANDLESAKAARDNYVQQWRSDAMQQLVKQQGELNSAMEQLSKADKRHELIEMRAPQDAIVLQVGDISVGSVVETAQKMFILVPSDAKLEVEAEISTLEQGFVHPGQEVEVKLDAWPFAKYGGLKGSVRSLSADSVTVGKNNDSNGKAVYLVKIDLESPNLDSRPDGYGLVPGMTLTSDIVVGKRTLAGYLFERASPALTEGMREP